MFFIFLQTHVKFCANILLLEIVSTVVLKTFIILETYVHAQGRDNMILI